MPTEVVHGLQYKSPLVDLTECGRVLLHLPRRPVPAPQATITCPRCQLKTSWRCQLEITRGGTR